jgi:uncharacterized membrane protein
MKNKVLAPLLMISFLFMLSCQTMPKVPAEHKGAATGAGIGAVAGSVLGAVIGDSTKSAVLGGLIGTLIGGAVGHYYYDQKRTGTETVDQYGYDPLKGPMLRIEDAAIAPQIVSPGGRVDLRMTYAVLISETAPPLDLIEKWEIRNDGVLVGNPEVHVTRAAGTYTANIPLTLPGDAKKGFYIVTCTVKSDTVSDALKSSFTVK